MLCFFLICLNNIFEKLSRPLHYSKILLFFISEQRMDNTQNGWLGKSRGRGGFGSNADQDNNWRSQDSGSEPNDDRSSNRGRGSMGRGRGGFGRHDGDRNQYNSSDGSGGGFGNNDSRDSDRNTFSSRGGGRGFGREFRNSRRDDSDHGFGEDSESCQRSFGRRDEEQNGQSESTTISVQSSMIGRIIGK